MALPVLAVAFSRLAATLLCLRMTRLKPTGGQRDFFQVLGQDQLNLFGHRYLVLSWVALAWGVFCALGSNLRLDFSRQESQRLLFGCATELYLVAVIATVCLPENFRTSVYAGWIGLLVSRLTLVTAIFGLLVLGISSLAALVQLRIAYCRTSLLCCFFIRTPANWIDMEASARDGCAEAAGWHAHCGGGQSAGRLAHPVHLPFH